MSAFFNYILFKKLYLLYNYSGDSMNIRDKKGFTLVELLAVIILLSIIMGIGTVSVTAIINNTKKKDYQKLIGEIGNAIEVYYQECKFMNNDCDSDSIITLKFLVENGYLKGNATGDSGDMTLVNPKERDKDISDCEIKYKFDSGKIKIEATNQTGSCPKTCDYDNSCVEG